MQPRMEVHSGLNVVGLGQYITRENASHIPVLWEQFAHKFHALHGRKSAARYGLCQLRRGVLDGQDALLYVAGVECRALAPVPEGLSRYEVPASRYAVWPHVGPIGELGYTWDRVWDEWLPQSGLLTRDSFAYELYGETWDPETGRGPLEIWVPVE